MTTATATNGWNELLMRWKQEWSHLVGMTIVKEWAHFCPYYAKENPRVIQDATPDSGYTYSVRTAKRLLLRDKPCVQKSAHLRAEIPRRGCPVIQDVTTTIIIKITSQQKSFLNQ